MPPIFSDGDDADTGQDQSEVFDEDNQNLADAGGRTSEMRTFEELPDVFDVTSAVGDSDDDAGLIGEELEDDEIIELKAWDAVRIPPGTWRGYEAGPEGLELLVIGAPNLGETPREDVEGTRDWWAD